MTGRFVDDYLLYLLARASAQASAEFHGQLKANGMAVPDWRIMAVLHGTDGVTIGELARRCLFKQPTLTRAVERLERKGLVVRKEGEGDRRRVIVCLTPQGADTIARTISEAVRHEGKLLSGYSASEADMLKKVLHTLIERTQGDQSRD